MINLSNEQGRAGFECLPLDRVRAHALLKRPPQGIQWHPADFTRPFVKRTAVTLQIQIPNENKSACDAIDAPDPIARLSALSRITNADVDDLLRTKLQSRLWEEDDQDVFLRLLLLISSIHRNSQDHELTRQIRQAMSRFSPLWSGTKEASEDALIIIHYGLSGVEFCRLSPEDRQQMLDSIP